MEKEIWKDVAGYEGLYQVSNFGRVKRLSTFLADKRGKMYRRKGCILHLYVVHKRRTKTDRLVVHLSKCNRRKAVQVHRLVATAFIPNPGRKAEVNHIDGNASNNRVDNLEWATRTENMRHAFDVLGYSPRYPRKRVRCIETGRTYPSMCAAARDTGISQADISRIVNHKAGRASAKGYHWEYAD